MMSQTKTSFNQMAAKTMQRIGDELNQSIFSTPQKRNGEFRNIRNMKNLYEEKSMQCKNIEVQD